MHYFCFMFLNFGNIVQLRLDSKEIKNKTKQTNKQTTKKPFLSIPSGHVVLVCQRMVGNKF